MKSRLCLCLAMTVLVSACGDGAPSSSDAEGVLNKMTAEFGRLLGNNHPEHVTVKDMKCAKSGDGIFDCSVLVTYPSLAGQSVQDRFRFAKLGGEWRATHMN